MKVRLFIIMFLTAAICFAQKSEIGGLIGGGAFAVSSGESSARGQAGVEACLFCSGRLGLFAEYSHWFGGSTRANFGVERVSSADLGGAGLRIQSQGRTRLFFDVGAVAGRDDHVAGGGGAIGGIVVGAGVLIPWREHWYFRPQVRAYGLSPHSIEGLGTHWAVSGDVGIGYRF